MSPAEKIGKVHLLYLSLLPALGSFVLFYILKTNVNPFLFFLLGTAGIGIYLAFTVSYTAITKNPLKNILILLDGPLWMLMSTLFGTSLAQSIVNDVVIEIASVLLGVLGVIFTSSIPTPQERRNAAIAVGLPFIGLLALFFTYSNEQMFTLEQNLILGAAVFQGAGTHFFVGSKMKIERESETYILIGIITWLLSFCMLGPFLIYIL